MDLLNSIITYENDEMTDDEEVKFFQYLIDTGHAWRLQGHYGRVAQYLIDTGLCTRQKREK